MPQAHEQLQLLFKCRGHQGC